MTVPFFQHQLENIKEDRKKFGIFKGTGSGKTRIGVALAKGFTLVICPKTQSLDGTWSREWVSQGKNLGDLQIISYDQFKIRYKVSPWNVTGNKRPQTVILDEAHKASGVQPYTKQIANVKYPRTSQLFVDILGFTKFMQPERVYPVTATPDAEPMKVFALAQILGCDWDFFKFRDLFYFEKKAKPGQKREGLFFVNRTEANKKLMGELINRIGWTGRLEDWNDVPPQIWKPHVCGITKEQLAEIPKMRLDYPDPRVLTGKIHKIEQGISEGWVVGDDGRRELVSKYIKETKIEAIEKYFNEFKKIIVFAKYTDQIELYKNYFEKKGIKVFVLNGKTKDKVRATITQDAEATEECIFIAQSSVSAGWELPRFKAVIFASLNHSFIDYDQALGRVQRANNIKVNTYIFLLSGVADEKVKKTIDAKMSFSEAKFAKVYGYAITGIKSKEYEKIGS